MANMLENAAVTATSAQSWPRPAGPRASGAEGRRIGPGDVDGGMIVAAVKMAMNAHACQ